MSNRVHYNKIGIVIVPKGVGHIMARQRKDYISLHIKFDADLMQRLNDYCDKEDRTKTAAVERMVRSYLDSWDKENNESVEERGD
jgi:hypothetical protein